VVCSRRGGASHQPHDDDIHLSSSLRRGPEIACFDTRPPTRYPQIKHLPSRSSPLQYIAACCLLLPLVSAADTKLRCSSAAFRDTWHCNVPELS
jgi:hypothetical protein